MLVYIENQYQENTGNVGFFEKFLSGNATCQW